MCRELAGGSFGRWKLRILYLVVILMNRTNHRTNHCFSNNQIEEKKCNANAAKNKERADTELPKTVNATWNIVKYSM